MNNVMPLRDHKGILWQRGKRQRPSEGELADRLAEPHSNAVRFLTGRERIHRRPALKAQWIYCGDIHRLGAVRPRRSDGRAGSSWRHNRRKGDVHGFDGVELRGDDDVQ